MPFQALTFTQIVQISIFGVIAWIACGVLFCVVIPGLSLLRGTEAYLILSGMGPSLPFGPWNMGVTWVVLRGWGVSLEAATTGMALYGTISHARPLRAAPLRAHPHRDRRRR